MAEEHRFQAPESHRLCSNNCGFFGSLATENLCSKCYRDLFLKETHKRSGNLPLIPTPLAAEAAPQPSPSTVADPCSSMLYRECTKAKTVAQPNRCFTCRKKVGLTGFKCRCGTTYCGTHRYPEEHGCTFDFKAMGREAIAKANPLVKAEKLEKI